MRCLAAAGRRKREMVQFAASDIFWRCLPVEDILPSERSKSVHVFVRVWVLYNP